MVTIDGMKVAYDLPGKVVTGGTGREKESSL
jgi:hypothetical protein